MNGEALQMFYNHMQCTNVKAHWWGNYKVETGIEEALNRLFITCQISLRSDSNGDDLDTILNLSLDLCLLIVFSGIYHTVIMVT